MVQAKFPNFSVVLPPRWGDITADLEVDNPPATVVRDDGVGALQFSIALYVSGPRPRGDVEELQELLDAFANKYGFTSPKDEVRESEPRGLVAASFQQDNEFVRAWYISENGNLAFVTYTSEPSILAARELQEVESIVRSLRFG